MTNVRLYLFSKYIKKSYKPLIDFLFDSKKNILVVLETYRARPKTFWTVLGTSRALCSNKRNKSPSDNQIIHNLQIIIHNP